MLRIAAVLLLALQSVAALRIAAAPAAQRLAVSAVSQPSFALRAAQPRMAEEEKPDKDNMMQQVKDAGIAGIISYVFWEWAFWGVSVPVCIFGYREVRSSQRQANRGRLPTAQVTAALTYGFATQVTGHWPDFSNQDDLAKLGAEAFAFVNVARFAIPLRIGLALSTTPWVRSNIVDKVGFLKKKQEA